MRLGSGALGLVGPAGPAPPGCCRGLQGCPKGTGAAGGTEKARGRDVREVGLREDVFNVNARPGGSVMVRGVWRR
jgi:hypothetical protein